MISRVEFESSRGYFAEALVAAETDGKGDQMVLSAEFKSPIGHSPVYFADVKRPVGFAQDDCRGLGDAEIIEPDICRLFALLYFGNLCFELGFRVP